MHLRLFALAACLLLVAGCAAPSQESAAPTPTSPAAGTVATGGNGTPAPGASPASFEVGAWFREKNPCPGSQATLVVEVSKDGFGVAGAKIEATWHVGGNETKAEATTDARGDAELTQTLGAEGELATVDLRVTHEGETAQQQASVRVRACDANGKPIMPASPTPSTPTNSTRTNSTNTTP